MNLRKITVIAIMLILLTSVAAKTKVMSFDNPGSKRLLKDEKAGNYYYFRPLPERSMKLNVAGIDKIELRSFSLERKRKAEVISIIDKKQTKHTLNPAGVVYGYHTFEAVEIPVPKDTKEMEILCYDRDLYFRAFYQEPPKPKTPTRKRAPNLVVDAHSGILSMTRNGNSSDYYSFTPDQPLRFTLNNSRNAVIYVRARLLDRELPVFDVYVNGKLHDTHEFSIKRTSTYSVIGIRHLSLGKKVTLPENSGRCVIELRAKTDHLFLGRPVLLKRK